MSARCVCVSRPIAFLLVVLPAYVFRAPYIPDSCLRGAAAGPREGGKAGPREDGKAGPRQGGKAGPREGGKAGSPLCPDLVFSPCSYTSCTYACLLAVQDGTDGCSVGVVAVARREAKVQGPPKQADGGDARSDAVNLQDRHAPNVRSHTAENLARWVGMAPSKCQCSRIKQVQQRRVGGQTSARQVHTVIATNS